jgi:hypothetical protein
MSRQSAHEGGKIVSPTHRPPLTHRRYHWYSFLLEAESAPGPYCDLKDYVNDKSQLSHWESNPRPSAFIVLPNCATACSRWVSSRHTGWAPELVWSFRRRKKKTPPPGVQSPFFSCPARRLVNMLSYPDP